jgi:hypothetical protein
MEPIIRSKTSYNTRHHHAFIRIKMISHRAINIEEFS